MKKYLIVFIISIFMCISNVYAEKIEVKFKTCIDGDTAIFLYDNEKIKARFLAIDTPETEYSVRGEQPLGDVASEYTCDKLKSAKKIILEYDKNSDKTDKYDRHLVWVWVDDKLLQKDIISKGYAKVDYLYDEYKYTEELKKEEEKAKEKKVGIWSSNNTKSNITTSNNNDTEDDIDIKGLPIPILIIIIIIILITKRKKRN